MRNKIICGRCEEIMAGMADNSVDIVITDPPFGVRKDEAWDDKDRFLQNVHIWLDECLRVSRTGVLWFCAEKMLSVILSRRQDFFQRILTWNKPPGSQYAGAMKNRIWFSSEPVLVFDKGGLGSKGKDAPFSYAVFNARTVPSKKFGCSTTKPVELMEWLVRHYTDPGDTVLDPFIGTGTTAVAAINTGRFFIGIEQDENLVQVARDRILSSQAQVCAQN